MGLHSGQALLRDGNYFGESVSRTASIRELGHGGQTLVSQATADAVSADLPEGSTLIDLGLHRLKDLATTSYAGANQNGPPVYSAPPRA
jgi:class 3 adenylate cyclase